MKRWTQSAGLAVGLAYLSLGALALSGGIVATQPEAPQPASRALGVEGAPLALGGIAAGIEHQGRPVGVEAPAAPAMGGVVLGIEHQGRPIGVELVAAAPKDKSKDKPKDKSMGRPFGVEFVAAAPRGE